MEKFVLKPVIDVYPGMTVRKDTVLEYAGQNIIQKLENLELNTVMQVQGQGYDATYEITVHLQEGDVLIFQDEKQGWIKPTVEMVSPAEAAEDLRIVAEMG